jgi:hypothetical protein
MPQWENKDKMLDDLYDHVFGDEDPSDEDKQWFEHLAKFFDDTDGGDGGNTHRRRAGNSGDTGSGNKGRRMATPPRRRSRASAGSGQYGSSAWFGSGE